MYHDKTEKFFVCGCYSHGLLVSADDNPTEPDPCCYFTQWYLGPNNRSSLWNRIKWAWGVLNGEWGPNELVFDRQQVLELIEHLHILEVAMKRGET